MKWKSDQSFPLTGCQWCCTATFMKCSLITSSPTTNRELVTLHTLWNIVWSPLFLWPTASQWHCTFCKQSQSHIFYQQRVSNITFSIVRGSLITSFLLMNRKWATIQISLKIVSWHPQQLVSGIAHLVKGNLITYDQQLVSDNANFLAHILNIL